MYQCGKWCASIFLLKVIHESILGWPEIWKMSKITKVPLSCGYMGLVEKKTLKEYILSIKTQPALSSWKMGQKYKGNGPKSDEKFVLVITSFLLGRFTNRFRSWSAFSLLFEKTPIKTIFVVISEFSIMAILAIFTILTIMAILHMVTNIVSMGVYLKSI